MSYIPNNRQLERLSADLRKIDFFEWGTRPLGFHFWDIDLEAYYKYYAKFIGRKFKYVIVLSKGGYEVQYRNKQQHQEFIAALQKEFASLPKLVRHEKVIAAMYSKMWKFCSRMRRTRWGQLSNKELAQWYKDYFNYYSEFIAAVSSAILLIESLARQLRLIVEAAGTAKPDHIELQIRALATPLRLSATAEEELALLKILTHGKRNLQQRLRLHAKKWAYIPVYAQFAPWTLGDFNQRIQNMSPAEINARLAELQNHRLTTLAKKRQIVKELKLGKDAQQLATLLSKYLFWRISDETTVGLVTFSRAGLFKEIAKRLYISQGQLLYMIKSEVLAALHTGVVNTEVIHERKQGYAYIQNPKGVAVVYGKNLKSLLTKVKLKSKVRASRGSGVLQGTPANPGMVRGKVCIVHDPRLIGKMKKGNILVTPQTTPAFITGMKIAGAIVTEEGGITSHAAIVSRELGLPCVIGVPDATRLLKDGDTVEVDADRGVVRKV